MNKGASRESTSGGITGRFVGRVKEALGDLKDDRDLAREGKLQQAKAEATKDAEAASREAELARREAELKEERADLEHERAALDADLTERERAAEADRERIAAEAEAERESAAEIGAAERAKEREHDAATAEDRIAEEADLRAIGGHVDLEVRT